MKTFDQYQMFVDSEYFGNESAKLLRLDPGCVAAGELAINAHSGVARKYSGRAYATHPCRVAKHLSTHPDASITLLKAAYCHDIIEDCPNYTAEMLEKAIGKRATKIVLEVSNSKEKVDSQGKAIPRAVKKAQDRDRLSKVSHEAKLLKLYDRLDNLFEIPEKCDFAPKYAQESLLLLEVVEEADARIAEMIRRRCQDLLS